MNATQSQLINDIKDLERSGGFVIRLSFSFCPAQMAPGPTPTPRGRGEGEGSRRPSFRAFVGPNFEGDCFE